MVQITPLLYAIPVVSHFKPTGSNGLAARQSIDPSSLPSPCQSSCQVINTMANCAGSLSCECASSIGSQLQECMSCLVKAEPSAESEAQAALSGWNEACNGDLTLSTASSSGGSSGGSGSSSGSSGGSSSGAVSVKTGSMAACIVAALAYYAFVSI